MINKPLPDLLRPDTLEDLVGQNHLFNENSLINKYILTGNLPSLIFEVLLAVETSLANLLVSQLTQKLF